MSTAQEETYAILPAHVEVGMHLALTLFTQPSLDREAFNGLWAPLWARLREGRRRRSWSYRCANSTTWADWSPDDEPDVLVAPWLPSGLAGLELVELGHQAGVSCEVWAHPPVLGLPRAGCIRLRFATDDSGAAAALIAAWGAWAIEHLPVWWGAGGWAFDTPLGQVEPAYQRLASLAKRYWGIQIQDVTALQWDALLGLPAVNWLTLIGHEFAKSRGTSTEQIVAAAAPLVGEQVFHRQAQHGVALAAGPAPIRGDINTGEDLGPYARIAALIQPLLLSNHTPLAGPLAKPEVLSAWLGRFSDPQAWLTCDIATD